MDFKNKNHQIVAGVVILLVILGIWWYASVRTATPTGTSTTTTGQTGGSTEATGAAGTSGGTNSENMGTTAGTTSGAGATGESGNYPTTSAGGESVSVADQSAGTMVTLGKVEVTRSTWVAVKDERDWILGAARFDASAESGTIVLLRATEAGKTYKVVTYVDDGDRLFDFHKDMEVKGEGAVIATFKAQ